MGRAQHLVILRSTQHTRSGFAIDLLVEARAVVRMTIAVLPAAVLDLIRASPAALAILLALLLAVAPVERLQAASSSGSHCPLLQQGAPQNAAAPHKRLHNSLG